MGKLWPVFFVLVLSIAISWIWLVALGDAPVPQLPDSPNWGPSDKQTLKQDISIRPFKINIDDKILNDLSSRLALETSVGGNRLTPPLENTGFQYGFNTDYLKTVTKYWLEKYDWRVRERLLNKYPHFKTSIFGLDIHFQHIKSGNGTRYKVTRPLLLLHGWPGSFVEFQKLIPMLLDPKEGDINFELVIPSLPGYGFSERAAKPGMGPLEIAQVMAKLMDRLGYKKYYVQGGDWGAPIATNIAILFPENAKGIHINMCLSLSIKSNVKFALASISPTLFMSAEEATVGYPFRDLIPRIIEETGYFHFQATKPDTIGVGLANSPSGLIAYILEKFSTWTNMEWRSKQDGGLIPYFKLDELLDNIMVYWVTNSITSSVRLYAEGFSMRQKSYNSDNVPVKVPTACLQPPKEVVFAYPRSALEERYQKLQRYNIAPKGGHFLAFEAPEVLAKDVTSFFSSLENSKSF